MDRRLYAGRRIGNKYVIVQVLADGPLYRIRAYDVERCAQSEVQILNEHVLQMQHMQLLNEHSILEQLVRQLHYCRGRLRLDRLSARAVECSRGG